MNSVTTKLAEYGVIVRTAGDVVVAEVVENCDLLICGVIQEGDIPITPHRHSGVSRDALTLTIDYRVVVLIIDIGTC